VGYDTGTNEFTRDNVVIGNRCNMLFIEGCLDKIRMDFKPEDKRK